MLIRRITESENETVCVGRDIGGMLVSGDIVLLDGDLGAGKTHLTSGIAQSLGVADYVTSPTFTLVNVYERDGTILNHFDIYRLADIDELYEIGFEEYLSVEQQKVVTVIEWSSVIPQIADMAAVQAQNGRIVRVYIRRRDDVSPYMREIEVEL